MNHLKVYVFLIQPTKGGGGKGIHGREGSRGHVMYSLGKFLALQMFLFINTMYTSVVAMPCTSPSFYKASSR